jgi:hypothetical protein
MSSLTGPPAPIATSGCWITSTRSTRKRCTSALVRARSRCNRQHRERVVAHPRRADVVEVAERCRDRASRRLAHERVVAHAEAARRPVARSTPLRDQFVGVLLDVVHSCGSSAFGGEDRRIVDQADRAGERVLEDVEVLARMSMRGRPSSSSGDQLARSARPNCPSRRARPSGRALARCRRLRSRASRCPRARRRRSRQVAALRDGRFEQLLDRAFALALRGFARQHAHVGRGHVAAGRQHVPVADDLAAGDGSR